MEPIPQGNIDEIEDTTRIVHAPVDHFNETFLLATSLYSRGYPINIKRIDRDHPNVVKYSSDDEFAFWEAENYDWVEIEYDSVMSQFIESTPEPGDVFKHDDPEVQKMINGHPIQLLWDIDVPNLDMQVSKLRWLNEGDDFHLGLKHPDPDYPWRELLERAIVTTGDRFYELTDQAKPIGYSPSLHSRSVYYMLKGAGVRPLNPEDLAGIIEDYYSYLEQNFPDLLALRS